MVKIFLFVKINLFFLLSQFKAQIIVAACGRFKKMSQHMLSYVINKNVDK